MIRNTIILNDKSSADIAGLIIQELPPITKPAQRTETEIIDGRDGDITTPLGFAAYDKEFTIGLYGDFDINAIIAFFNSEGTVVFSNESDKYYNYQINDQIDFERLVRFRTAKVKMHVQPFKYSSTQGAETLDPPAENLLSIPDYTNTTNGVTLTVSDGTISVSGTPNAATEFYVPTGGLNLPAGSYTLTAEATGTRVAAASIRLIGSVPSDADSFGGNYLGLRNAQPVNISDTLAAAKTFSYLWFYITAGGEVDFNMTAEVQNNAEKTVSDEGTFLTLENSAEAPFNKLDLKGDSFQQTYAGKNLFNIAGNFVQGFIGDSGIITSEGTSVACTDYIEVKPNTTYIGSFDVLNNTASELRTVAYYTSDKTFISRRVGVGRSPFTTPENAKFIRVNFRNADGMSVSDFPQNYLDNIQIEEGSTATDFEQYVGGAPSPNPDYPQDVKVVTGEQMVNVTGKNLFNYFSRTFPYTANGITATLAEDGTITITGTPTSNYVRIVPNIDITELLKDGETYTLSATTDDRDFYLEIVAARVGGGNHYYGTSSDGSTHTFTVDKTTHSSYRISVSTYTTEHWGEGEKTISEQFQLEKGSNATNFEPYKAQNFDIFLSSSTKNIFNKDTATVNRRIANNGSIIDESGYFVSDFIPVLPNTDYIISPSDYLNYSAIATYDSDKNFIRRLTGASFSQITTDANAAYIRFDTDINNIETTQLEKGSVATSYVAFMPIELCKVGGYQDYIWTDGEKWYKHATLAKATFDGDENWSIANSGTANYYYQLANAAPGTLSTDNFKTLLSNYERANTVYNTNTNQGVGVLASGLVRLRSGAEITLADWKAKLAATPMVLYYPLATPTDEEITNETLVVQLNALHGASAYRGRTHIISTAGSSDNLPQIVAAEVMKISDGTITNAGNIYSKPRLTIYGPGDITINLNGIQLFQIALGSEGYITIDTAAMEAYQDSPGNLKNRLVTGDYDNFVLNPGENQITFSGLVTKCIVENYSRWL